VTKLISASLFGGPLDGKQRLLPDVAVGQSVTIVVEGVGPVAYRRVFGNKCFTFIGSEAPRGGVRRNEPKTQINGKPGPRLDPNRRYK